MASVQGGIRIVNRQYKPEYNDTNSAEYFEITQVIIVAVRAFMCKLFNFRMRIAESKAAVTSYYFYYYVQDGKIDLHQLCNLVQMCNCRDHIKFDLVQILFKFEKQIGK